MQISNVLAGHPDPAALAKRGESVEAAGGRPPKTVGRQAVPSAASAAAMADILADYDVRDISPAEFSEMIQKLFDAGTISQQELQQLAAIRLDLDVENVEADESVDLLEFYTRKIEKIQRGLSDSDTPATTQQQLAPLLSRLDWLEKFALIQSSPETIGLDAVA